MVLGNSRFPGTDIYCFWAVVAKLEAAAPAKSVSGANGFCHPGYSWRPQPQPLGFSQSIDSMVCHYSIPRTRNCAQKWLPNKTCGGCNWGLCECLWRNSKSQSPRGREGEKTDPPRGPVFGNPCFRARQIPHLVMEQLSTTLRLEHKA